MRGQQKGILDCSLEINFICNLCFGLTACINIDDDCPYHCIDFGTSGVVFNRTSGLTCHLNPNLIGEFHELGGSISMMS